MIERNKIISRIRALMEKTVDNGCTEAEAMTAAEKVGKMMTEYDISSGEFNFKDEICVQESYHLNRGTVHPVHHCVLAVSKYTATKCFYRSGRKHGYEYIFFGMPVDVEIAKGLMNLIYNCMEFQATLFKCSDTYKKASAGKTARDSFLKGMAFTISSRLNEMSNSRHNEIKKTTGRDLVIIKDEIVNDEFNKLNLKIKKVSAKSLVKELESFEKGIEKGKEVNLNTSIIEK